MHLTPRQERILRKIVDVDERFGGAGFKVQPAPTRRLRFSYAEEDWNFEAAGDIGDVSALLKGGFIEGAWLRDGVLLGSVAGDGVHHVRGGSAEPAGERGTVTQIVYGPVGELAGGDINKNITVITVLEALEEAARKSADIPAPEKASLVEKLRALRRDPYVVSVGSASVMELVKGYFGV